MEILKSEVDRTVGWLKRLGTHLRTLKALDGKLKESEVGSVYASLFDQAVEVGAAPGADARTLALDVARALGTKKPIGKRFNSGTGRVTYTIAAGKMKVEVSGGEARCKVAPVVKKVWVEPTEGYFADRTEYVIVNPEECGAA